MKKILAAMIAVGLCLALCGSAMAQHRGPGPGYHPGLAPHHAPAPGYRPGPAPYRPVPPPPYRPAPPPPRYYRPLPPPPPAPVVVPLPAPAPLYTPGYYYPRSGIYLNTPNVGISIGL